MHKYLSVVKKHRVPLSDSAVALLEGLPRLK
ncbi:integrase, partial [Salmonella enterica]|nr:integrase [Salmonella enterica]